MKVKNNLNASTFIKPGEINNKPSVTIPDQAMSVREIVNRFARGLGVDGARVAIYEGEEEGLPNLTNMDLADREALLKHYAEELAELQAKQANEQTVQQQQTPE